MMHISLWIEYNQDGKIQPSNIEVISGNVKVEPHYEK